MGKFTEIERRERAGHDNTKILDDVFIVKSY